MFATGAVLLPFFSFLTYLIAVPTGIKFFNWIGTMWRGSITFETPMLFVDRLPGHVPVRRADRRHAGLARRWTSTSPTATSWWRTSTTCCSAPSCSRPTPASTSGSRSSAAGYLDERLGKLHFWLTFIGFHTTFLVQHWLGAEGMPRRYADYLPTDGFTTLNTVSTIGSFVLGASTLPFLYNVYQSWKYGELVTADDPWGHGNSLEWATSSPAAAAQLHVDPADPLRAARRSRRTTRTCSSGWRPRRTPASGTGRTPAKLVGAGPAPGRARRTPTRPDPRPPSHRWVAADLCVGD